MDIVNHHSHSSHEFPTIIDVKLNGDNYMIWAGSVHMIIRGLRLLSHIDSTPPPEMDYVSSVASGDSSSSAPPPLSVAHGLWRLDDHRTMTMNSWSLEPDVRIEVIYLETAQEIWNQLRHRFEHSSTT